MDVSQLGNKEAHVADKPPCFYQKTTCQYRQQGCRFCELELPVAEICEHEEYCGSRTKKCEECGEYVMLKYEQLHLDSNHSFLKLDDGMRY